MRTKILIVILFIVVCFAITTPAKTPEVESSNTIEKPKIEEKVDVNKMSYVEMIDYVAPQFGQNPTLIKKVIYNESGFKVQCHDSCRAKNITAIHDTTFKGWLPKYKKEIGETLNINSQYDQIKMLSWAFSKGESYRKKWTTYVSCKNPSGTYSFYSNLLEKNFTVICKPLPAKYI